MKTKEVITSNLRILIVFALIFFVSGAITFATNSKSSGNVNLTIYDEVDLNGTLIKVSNRPFTFYANFTNSSGVILNEGVGGNCTITFNYSGIFEPYAQMIFNQTMLAWQYNRTFNYKGEHVFRVNCTSDDGSIELDDNFSIINSIPNISMNGHTGKINLDGNPDTMDYLMCSEDSLCIFNFSSYVSDPDVNDILTYGYIAENTTLTNFTLNSSTGILLINITNNLYCGTKQIGLNVKDTESVAVSGILNVNISSVNDAPVFTNLRNQSFNMSNLFNYTINVYDEENDSPFAFNITFLNCSVAPWSTRNCSTLEGRQLFNETFYQVNETTGTINIAFTPSKNDVGDYLINFSVTDSGVPNKTTSQIVNFSVLNVNSPPEFVYICDNERNWNENDNISCVINASDIDEVSNLTLIANYSWFLFNHSSNTLTLSAQPSENVSFVVNFTPDDMQVGRWNINLTLVDSLGKSFSKEIQFNIYNIDDNVSLDEIKNITAYSTNFYEIFVNASDDDLLIPDKNVFNEQISFYSNFSCVSITSLGPIAGTNKTQAKISFNASNSSCFTPGKNYSVKISANDSNNFSGASREFIIYEINNTAPVWNLSTFNISSNEDEWLTLNLSLNVSDAQNDILTFSFVNESAFPSFSIDANTGLINFKPNDRDVGLHYVNISVSDGATSSTARFNFTILNKNDLPFIPLNNLTGIEGNNLSIILNDTVRVINATEDTSSALYVNVYDDDLLIPPSQKQYYNESFVFNITIEGPNQTIINFTESSYFDGSNRTKFGAFFTPKKGDVGYYNVTINVSDMSNETYAINFTLIINKVNHFPELLNIQNQTSSYNATWFYDINASDIEDGNDSDGNLTFFYNIFYNTTPYLHSLLKNPGAFNPTLGIFNVAFNDTSVGVYGINISVEDREGYNTTKKFWLFVYDKPLISLPLPDTNLNASENFESNFTFKVNHIVADNLTYFVYLNSELKYNLSYYGNGTEFVWRFTPNYTEETYGLFANLTLFVLNPSLNYINSTKTWKINISHTNAPVYFNGTIPNSSKAIDQRISYNLLNYFNDIDVNDPVLNESLNYNVISNESGGITYSISNNEITFSSSPLPSNGTFMITATDSEYNASSNWFMVEFVATQSTSGAQTSTGGSGGGGGTTVKKVPVLLKLILPDPASMDKKDKITLPVTLVNEGEFVLNGIRLFSSVSKNGSSVEKVRSYFNTDYFDSMPIGSRENVELTIESNTDEVGVYEIIINATVDDPKYEDWGKIYITIHEGKKIEERILFIDEFIIGNPECIELKEIIEEAKKALQKGEISLAEKLSEDALAACKQAISQKPNPKKVFSSEVNVILNTTLIAILGAFGIGIIYYFYRRRRLQAVLEERDISSFLINK